MVKPSYWLILGKFTMVAIKKWVKNRVLRIFIKID